jgi:PKD repeat protein
MEGFPITYAQWDGVGELDGNEFSWVSATNEAEGVYPVHIIASDGTAGNGYNGAEAEITVSNTVAELSVGVISGTVPLAVNFSSAGSRDRDANTLTYLWNFDDGTTSTSANPGHIFLLPGFYKVSLTVTGPLGSNSATQIIDVRHKWPLALNNGWDPSNGIDSNIWTATGSSVGSGSLGTWLQFSGGTTSTPVGITSVRPFNTPLYIEAEFRRPTYNWRGSGFQILGSLLGHLDGVTENYFQELDYSIGHPSEANPSVWDFQFVGSHMRVPELVSTLRLYVKNDPNHPGKIRYRGYLDADLGRYFIQFDDQDPAESWFDNLLGATSINSGIFYIWRYQVWTPAGTNSGPEIHVLGADGQSIEDPFYGTNEHRKDAIVVDEATEFSHPAVIGGNVTRSYTIKNLGDTTLNLAGPAPHVTITGANAADYNVTSTPSPVITPGGRTNFTVTFKPGGSGRRLATINIASNDPDESTLTFDVRGWERTAREINLEGNGINIPNGAGLPNTTDYTDFGSVSRVASAERKFMVQNLGLDDLSVTGVTITGAHVSDFNVTKIPRQLLKGLESSLFKIQFTPGDLGVRSATVKVASDDADEGSYSFDIQGVGIDEIQFDQASLSVPEGGSAPLGVKLSNPPAAPITVTITMLSGAHLDGDVTVQSKMSLNFDGSNWNSYQTVTLGAAEDDTDTIGGIAVIRFNSGSPDFPDSFFVVLEQDNDLLSKPVADDQSVSAFGTAPSISP